MTPASTGRAVPAPLTHTFPNGVIATVRQPSQFTLAAIEIGVQKQHPKPQPPLAPGVGGEMEPNPADPRYEAALTEWQQAIQLHVFAALLELYVDVEIDQATLDTLRGSLDRIGIALDEISDKVAYIKHCCVQDVARDLAPVAALIRGQVPTEADVQAHVDMFPRDVGGPGSDAGVRTTEQGTVLRPV